MVVVIATGALASTVAPAQATSISEFSVAITSPAQQITYGPDGNSWFTEPGSPNRIGKITPTGGVIEYTTGLTLNAGLGGITAGPDGNVWFTETLADKVGRITPAGVVTEFGAGMSGSPQGIAAGPDGNLWFTEDKAGTFGSDEIGRMTPAGALTIFTSGLTAGSTPAAITAGSDGNLWFTEQSGGRIGRVTPTGTITEFAAGLSPRSVQAIASGSDGNLWVTESSANAIARVTTAGVATQFSAGITPSSQPAAITSGPDGSLWFTEPTGNRVARITPAGTVTEYAAGITPSSSPEGLAMGSDLNLWFTETGGPRIGRVYQPGIRGVDVSHYSGTVNWSQVAGAGYSFGYASYGEGTTYLDPTFSANWAGMAAAGMSRGASLVFHPGVDPTAQAHVLDRGLAGAGFTPQDLVPAFDVEVTDGQSASTIAANLQTAVNAIKADLGVWPVIFTSSSYWITSVGNLTTFGADPLWIASYLVRSPRVPANNWNGNGWRLWQYTGTGVVPGISAATTIDQASWAGLPLMGGPAIRAVLPAMANGAYGGYVTAATIQNTGSEPATVQIAYFDQNGAPVGTGDSISNLGVNASWTVRQDNGNAFPSTGGSAVQAGSAIVYSTQPIASFVNEFAPGNLGDATSYTGVQLPSGVGPTLYAPAIANNAYGGYTTGIGLLNQGSSPTDVTITYRNGGGTIIKTQMVSGLAAHAYHAVYSGDAVLALPDGFAGTATITSSAGQPLGAIVNETGPGGQFSSYDAVRSGSTLLNVPVALNNAYGGYFTGIGIQNTAATGGTVSVTYYDAAGTATAKSFSIPANGYLGVYQGSATDGPAPGAYTAVIQSSTVALAAIVNETAPASGTARQSTSYNTFGTGSTILHLPLVENGGSDPWNTGEGIMNTGTGSTTVTVNYYDAVTGAAIGTAQTHTLAPQAFWGLYQPGGGLPSGSRATAVATISTAGQVAIICNESNATTFMSYNAQ